MPLLAGLLCLLLLGFAGASYGAVRWDVVQAPTEVVNTGRSEVTGSVSLIARGAGTTGTSSGGDTQIGLIYTNPSMQIDNRVGTGIRLVASGVTATIVLVENFDLNGRCTGRITINIPAAQAVADASFIRVEGVRGRIDASLAVTPGTDLFVDLQSINDPAANIFTPDRVRVAKSLDGMNIKITPTSLLLCFPTSGLPPGGTLDNSILITEGFARAFVDDNSTTAGTDRVDTTQALLGTPTTSTQFQVFLEAIPASVSGIVWEDSVLDIGSGLTQAQLVLVDDSEAFDATTGTASARYSFEANNQTDVSDINVEQFRIAPRIVLKSGATQTGTVLAGVTLAPAVDAAAACSAPQATDSTAHRPRFLRMIESDDVATNNPPDDPTKEYATIIRCNCYLLFTYVTANAGFDTGVAIANTTGDTAVFGDNEAPNQLGKITFYFFDRNDGFVGSTETAADVTTGTTYVNVLSGLLPTGVTAFEGYVIAKADFQFCHGFAFIADSAFATIAHGYVANVIPDPAIKNSGGHRTAAAAGDPTNIPAGESLNN
jgi:hypothetical protein